MDPFFDWSGPIPPSLIGLDNLPQFTPSFTSQDLTKNMLVEDSQEQLKIQAAQDYLRKADYEGLCQHFIDLIQWIDEAEPKDSAYITIHNILEKVFSVDIRFNESLAKYLDNYFYNLTAKKLKGIFRFYGIFLDKDMRAASDSFSDASSDSSSPDPDSQFAAMMLEKIRYSSDSD
jgi:hypothetical protein